jgi:hypothetical protein
MERYAIVRLTTLARAPGLLSAQRIFLIGTGRQCRHHRQGERRARVRRLICGTSG